MDEDLRPSMPLLEGTLSASGLDGERAQRLVEFVFGLPWNDYWVSRALDWVDEGVDPTGVVDALRRISQDKKYSQETRHRAWRLVKARP